MDPMIKNRLSGISPEEREILAEAEKALLRALDRHFDKVVLVLNTGSLHGWMVLYNNGFCLGLVCTFFVPAILLLLRRDIKKPD